MKKVKLFLTILLFVDLSRQTINERNLSAQDFHGMINNIHGLAMGLKVQEYKIKCEPEKVNENTKLFKVSYFKEKDNGENYIEVKISGKLDKDYKMNIEFVNGINKGFLSIERAKFEFEKESLERFFQQYQDQLISMNFDKNTVLGFIKDIIKSFNSDYFEFQILDDNTEGFSFIANSKQTENDNTEDEEDQDLEHDGGDHLFEVFIDEDNKLIIKNDFFQNVFSLDIPTKDYLDKEIKPKLNNILIENERLKKFSQSDKKMTDFSFDCQKLKNKLHIFKNINDSHFEFEVNDESIFSRQVFLISEEKKNNVGTLTCIETDDSESLFKLIYLKFKVDKLDTFETVFPQQSLYNIEPLIESFIEHKLYDVISFVKNGSLRKNLNSNEVTGQKEDEKEDEKEEEHEEEHEERILKVNVI